MLMVDIAVPRDIEAQVGDLRDVYLYSVDDLRNMVDQNKRGRESEARKADLIIAEGVASHREAERSLAAVDTVKEYRTMAEQLKDQELHRALRMLSRGDDPAQVLAQMARGLTQKLIHAPSAGLKTVSASGREDLIAHARKLLGLSELHQPTSEKSINESDTGQENVSQRTGQATFSSLPTDPSETTLQ